jgi:hypothetical protein
MKRRDPYNPVEAFELVLIFLGLWILFAFWTGA